MQNPNIERLLFIKHLITRKASSQNEIIDAWRTKSGFQISKKTVTRDIESLRNLMYEIHDSFVNRKLHYKLVDSRYEHEILERYSKYLILAEKPDMNTKHLITSPTLKGVNYIPILIRFIEHNVWTTFRYHPFQSESTTRKTLPLVLKEYQGRWYLFAFDGLKKAYRTFGIDRITELRQIKESDHPPGDKEEHIELFKQRLGTSMPLSALHPEIIAFSKYSTPQVVRLSVSPFLLKHIKSKPIHRSQVITDNVTKRVKFTTGEKLTYTSVELYLVPNYDLIKLIISELGDIIVEEPKNLAHYIQTHFKNLIEEITGK